MELNLLYEQDFTKKGKLSKFGGSEFGVKGPKDFKSYQIEKLTGELLKYNILESRVRDITKPLYKINSIEYMNIKYLAAVINILESIEGIEYKEQEEFDEIATYLFKDKEFLKSHLEKIIDIENSKDSKYLKAVKNTLFTYLYKIWANRHNEVS
jgi:hypothetical protein